MTDNKRKSISLAELLEIEKQEGSLEVNLPSLDEPNKRLSDDELRQAKKDNKYYLPVLNINDPLMWPSKPKSQRRMFTDKEAERTCLKNCCNVPGLWSACCRLDPDDIEHVLGPVSEKCIKKIVRFFDKKGISIKRDDIVIDFEEGKLIGEQFFNGHQIFSKKTSYPMMRIQPTGPRFGCKFLNPANGMCNIYEVRPNMCQNYLCSYVKSNFLVKTNDRPNTFRMIDS